MSKKRWRRHPNVQTGLVHKEPGAPAPKNAVKVVQQALESASATAGPWGIICSVCVRQHLPQTSRKLVTADILPVAHMVRDLVLGCHKKLDIAVAAAVVVAALMAGLAAAAADIDAVGNTDH